MIGSRVACEVGIPDLISGAKRTDHRIRGLDAHTKNDFDEYGGVIEMPLRYVNTALKPTEKGRIR